MKKHSASLFIFHRDLRLDDNRGLIKALEESEIVYPIFIFDQRQVQNNEYRSDNALQFMIESIEDLNKELVSKKSKVGIYNGLTDQIVKRIIKEYNIDAIYSNFDYTPFSKIRDNQIANICRQNEIAFELTHDYLLNTPQDGLKQDGTPYTIFTPYFRNASTIKVEVPNENKRANYGITKNSLGLSEIKQKLCLEKNDLLIKGGRENALQILSKLKNQKEYAKTRDIPQIDSTTHLSAHLKFGTVSVREVYFEIVKKLGVEHDLIRQLYWRDFFSHIAYWFPHVFGNSFNRKYNRLTWENNKEKIEAWKNGRTGFPIVDAGMRQLNKTGFMHNRVRMICASFLIKDLDVDWRIGEKYFAQKLVDYDPAVNNGNWQWAASTGCDAQPYFRIFNPWRQQKKFDPECEYIKKWIKELKSTSIQEINNSERTTEVLGYPTPIVEHTEEARKTKSKYSRIVNY